MAEVYLISFGYRHGVPKDCDLVFDARCLHNPHRDPALRYLTGLDKAVQREVWGSRAFGRFVEQIVPPIATLAREKGEIVVGVGCLAGHHRSVATVEWLAHIIKACGDTVVVDHRELGAEGRA